MAIAAVALSVSAAAAPMVLAAPASEPAPGPPVEVDYESGAKVRIEGVELDRRFGRAWLIATLTGDGHLRTTSTRVKAFAPSGELEAGLVRIPLIPRLPVAKELRREGSAAVSLDILFRPKGKPDTEYRRRKVLLLRDGQRRPARPHH